MKVLMLAHNLTAGGGVTVGRNLIATLPGVDRRHTFVAAVPPGLGYEAAARESGARLRMVPSGGLGARLRFESTGLRAILREEAPDWVLALGNVPVRRPGCRQALLLHDPHLVYSRDHYPRELRRNLLKKRIIARQIRAGLSDVDAVFLQTKTMRERFRRSFRFTGRLGLCPVAPSRFATDGHAGDVDPRIADAPRGGRFLVLTRYYAHKNLELLVEAYDRFRAELAGTTCALTIEPEEHPGARELLAEIDRRGLGRQIVNVGRLAPDRLPAHYAWCDVLLQPSLLESFTSTYVEAMYFGRPIATADLDFAHEVCGDAAEYFDPWSANSLAQAMERLARTPGRRDELARAGQARLTESARGWRDCVAELADVLGLAASRGASSSSRADFSPAAGGPRG